MHHKKAVAVYADPADFESYTEAYLDAHTAAMDTLAEAFDNLTIVFVTLKPADACYALAASFYKANCDTYVFAASAYTKAAHCAIDTALNGQFQSVIDNADLLVKGVIESTTPATNYEVLERKATIAEAKAKAFLVKCAIGAVYFGSRAGMGFGRDLRWAVFHQVLGCPMIKGGLKILWEPSRRLLMPFTPD